MLSGCPAPINQERVASNERSCGRGEKYDSTDHVARFAHTVQASNAFDYVGAKFGVSEGWFGSGGSNEG